ncbi:MAG: hypothetical protein RR036_00470 [Oscillospiraceae bacterium]
MVVILAVIVSAVIVFFCYRQGLKDGICRLKDEKLEQVINLKNKQKPTEVQRKQTIEQQKMSALMRNLEVYDGTKKGQVKL